MENLSNFANILGGACLIYLSNNLFFLVLPFCPFIVFIMAISLATINVNGIAERHKRVKVFELLRSFKHDIFFLQETHLADALQGKAWEKEWGGQRGPPAQIDRRVSLCLFTQAAQWNSSISGSI